jgi:hypothetical protein
MELDDDDRKSYFISKTYISHLEKNNHIHYLLMSFHYLLKLINPTLLNHKIACYQKQGSYSSLGQFYEMRHQLSTSGKLELKRQAHKFMLKTRTNLGNT